MKPWNENTTCSIMELTRETLKFEIHVSAWGFTVCDSWNGLKKYMIHDLKENRLVIHDLDTQVEA